MMRTRRLPAALALGALLTACGEGRLSGGYDDVENPAILVALSDASGKVPSAGALRLYARYQNPLLDSLPLLEVAGNGDSLVVEDSAVRAAFARAQSLGIPSPGKDTLEFNLIAAAEGGESFLGGYALIKRTEGWGFIRRVGNEVDYPDAKGVLARTHRLAPPVMGQTGSVGAKGVELGLKSVFIPGSPYGALLAGDGTFGMARIARGRFELKSVSSDEKVYTAADSLEAGAGYTASDWAEADIIWVNP